MRGLVITNKYAQPLVIKRLGMDRSCLADSNIFFFVLIGRFLTIVIFFVYVQTLK